MPIQPFSYDKNIFASNLNYYMKKHHDTQVDIARLLGVSKSTVSSYCAGTQMPRMDKIEALSIHFGIRKSELLETPSWSGSPDNIIPLPKMNRVPLIGTIACGDPILAQENIDEQIDLPEHIHADFALRCKGDSMINARIFDGDIVYIRHQPTVLDGQIAAVLIDGEATLKRVRLFDDHIVLEPENPQYRPLSFWGPDMNTPQILGLAVAFTSTVK